MLRSCKTKKLPLKIIAENSVIQQGNESNMTVMKNLPLLEKKGGGGGGEYELKVKALKKKIAQKMRSSVKLLRTFKKLLLLHLQKDN